MKVSLKSLQFCSLLLLSSAALSQENENPPVLKLDRIPSSPAFLGQTRVPAATPSTYLVETLAGGLSVPWALAFLPDGDILINGVRQWRNACC